MTGSSSQDSIEKATIALRGALDHIELHSEANFFHIKKSLIKYGISQFDGPSMLLIESEIRTQIDGAAFHRSVGALIEAMKCLGRAYQEQLYGQYAKAEAFANKAIDLLSGAGLAAVKGKVGALSSLRRWAVGTYYGDEEYASPETSKSAPIQYVIGERATPETSRKAQQQACNFIAELRARVTLRFQKPEDQEWVLNILAMENADYFLGFIVGQSAFVAKNLGEIAGGTLSQLIARNLFEFFEDNFDESLTFEDVESYLSEDHPPEFSEGLADALSRSPQTLPEELLDLIEQAGDSYLE